MQASMFPFMFVYCSKSKVIFRCRTIYRSPYKRVYFWFHSIKNHKYFFKNKLIRKLFRPNRTQVKRLWLKLRNENCHSSCTSSSVMKEIRFREIRETSYVAQLGEIRNSPTNFIRGRDFETYVLTLRLPD